MNARKGLTAIITMIIAVVAITSIIFANSLKDIAASHRASDSVITTFSTEEKTDDVDFVRLVRKSAHLVEYAVLGTAVMLLVKIIQRYREKKLYGTACFYALLVAVTDEHIQSFSDRTSSTDDILLDFLGALIGFAIALVTWLVYERLRRRYTAEGE